MSEVETRLPEGFRQFFWDYDFDALSWLHHRDLIVRRLLSQGSWQAIGWLRRQMGDEDLRRWLMEHQGGRLSPRQLRFWELVLDLPKERVQQWVEQAKNSPWNQRIRA